MNLIDDSWIPVIGAGGERFLLAPWELAGSTVCDVAAVRPDFQGALYQFLIGLLQTSVAPEDQDEWLDLWYNAPDQERLKAIFSKYSAAFELFAENGMPAFLQDFNMLDGEIKPIAALLIESPGGKTLKDNLDHFVKGGVVGCACESCAATALFTLQTNAPSGGVGHRVGLRGGGPLTSLLMPETNESSLWKKLWLNVLTAEELDNKNGVADVFPWMASTRVSDKNGKATLPADVSLLQMYWGMPRRIRLEYESASSGVCSLCGAENVIVITHYRTKNYGVNYEGPWVHPLTPYRIDAKKEKPPLSLKGQQGGLGYRHWLGLNWLDASNGDQAALTVQNFNRDRVFVLNNYPVTMRCYGFDMDNMKARCWYEHQLPVVSVPKEYQELFINFITDLINAARDVAKELRSQVKAAWFSRPKDVKGDTSTIDTSFWEATESVFYQQLYSLSKLPSDTRFMPQDVAEKWVAELRIKVKELFDFWVLEGDAEDLDMKRITKARRTLFSKIKSIKTIKHLEQIANAETEVA